jgi:hypothetical protein
MASTERPSDSAQVGATRARQGRWGFHVFLVLLIGTVLAALAMFGALMWKSDDLGDSNVNNGPAAEARKFNAPEPQAIQTPPGTASTPAQAPENATPAAPAR